MKNALTALSLAVAALALASGPAHAQEKVKIGFVTDMSSLYADVEGKNGALAIQMAVIEQRLQVGQPLLGQGCAGSCVSWHCIAVAPPTYGASTGSTSHWPVSSLVPLIRPLLMALRTVVLLRPVAAAAVRCDPLTPARSLRPA